MDAKKFWLPEFISEKRTFVIPVYQRNYDWKVANCEKLFEDIKRIIEKGKPHFIGTFVYKENSGADIFRELVIIDGQQRITSTILFARALCEFADENLKDDIRSTFIKHSRGDLQGKCKLCPTKYDRAVFEKLMSDVPFDETNFTDAEKKSYMYVNFACFRKAIAESNLKPKDLQTALHKLNVVVISLDDEENPQAIFESLNSTGLALTKADLIRNFLLMSLEYSLQEELYTTCWLEIEKLLRLSGNVENFIIQHLIVKFKSNDVYNQKVSPKTLYDLFTRYFKDECSENAESCLKDMLRYAKFFRRCIFDDAADYSKLSALEKKFYELTFLLKAKNAPIILMYLLDRNERGDFDEATFTKFVDALISLAFRAKVCGNNGITQQFAGNVLARLYKNEQIPLDENFFWRTLVESSKVTFPNDKDFQTALVSNKLYTTIKSDACKYLLYSLERNLRDKELPAYSEATVEHILPQKLNDAWKKYLAEHSDSQAHEIFLHTLGNLTLTGENSTLGNMNFDAKKEIYSRSNFYYTRKLIDSDEWTSKQIQARAKRLAASALKIWTLPEGFNSVIPDLVTVFNLDSDFSALTGRKPAKLLIFGAEIDMPSWIEMLREIVRQLYALDKDAFRRAAQQGNVRKSLFTTEPTDFKIDDGFYMSTRRYDAKVCLTFSKVLTENFDALGDTNFKSEILFTLRAAE
ncbi:MAG: DUF262 domain-containing protein [Selenomonadaceae bacterium]|nr:DUF262 domain-containing protein [Selenomonadaceae bacterium]